MEKSVPQPASADSPDDWILQANRESMRGLNEMRIEAGLEPIVLEPAERTSRELLQALSNLEVEKAPKEESFNIDDYVGEFYD